MHWTPIATRPPVETWLLVTVESAAGRYVAKAMLSQHGYWTGVGNSEMFRVVAWMPLPEPWGD